MDTIKSHKVVLLGDSTVGKTCLAHRMKHNSFMHCPDSTIGCEFFAHTVESVEGKVKLLIWDTAGQEVFRSFTPQFLRNAVLVLLVYDTSVPLRLYKIESWIKMVPEDAIILVVPTKSDLPSAANNSDSFQDLNSSRPIYFSQPTSAKSGDNIEALLEKMVEVLRTHFPHAKCKTDAQNVEIVREGKGILDCCLLQ